MTRSEEIRQEIFEYLKQLYPAKASGDELDEKFGRRYGARLYEVRKRLDEEGNYWKIPEMRRVGRKHLAWVEPRFQQDSNTIHVQPEERVKDRRPFTAFDPLHGRYITLGV